MALANSHPGSRRLSAGRPWQVGPSDLWPAVGAAVSAAAIVAGVLSLRPSVPTLLIGGCATTVAIPLLFRIVQRTFDPFEPLLIFALAWGGMFVVRPIAMLHNDEFSYLYAPGLHLRGTFDRMLALALIGGLSFVVGYASPLGNRLAARAPSAPTGERAATVTLIATGAAALGLASFGLFILQSGLPLQVIVGGRSLAFLEALTHANKYFVLGPVLLVGATLVIFAMGLDRRRPALVCFSVALAAITWLVWNTAGSRLILFPMFAAMAIFFYLSRDRRPAAITLLVAAAVAIFASAVVVEQRNPTKRQEQGISGVASQVLSHPRSMFDPLVKGPDNSMAPGLAAALTLVPSQVHYSYGWWLVRDLVSRPIPRVIWRGKPRPPREELVSRINLVGFNDGWVNPEFSTLLVPYLSWGMFGGLFLVLYGVLARAVYEWFNRNRTELSGQLIYALTLPLFLPLLRDSLVDAVALWCFMVLPVWLLFSAGRIRLAG